MPLLRLKLSDLQTLSAPSAESLGGDGGPGDAAGLEARIRRQFRFLPDPITVKVEGDEVVVEFPEETPGSRAEAARLAEKAGKRASEGNYGKAIDIYQRVLELQPSLHRARRDLAMIYVETGDVDNATNHLIEVLRLDPSDSWNWVVLGNLYAGGKNDPETAEKFIRKALELNPNDPWALNSLATFTQKAGRSEEALALFDQAIAAHPDLPNPYLGKALVLDATKQTEAAAGTLEQLFTMGRLQDARSHEVYDNARNLYVRVQAQLAERQQSEAFKCVQNEKAELVALSGYPVEMAEGDLTGTVGAMIQMAWKHRRDHHVIVSRRNHDPILLFHLEAHELTHLRMETEARKVGRNRFFSSNPAHREVAMKEVASDLWRFSRNGYSEESLMPLFHNLIGGATAFADPYRKLDNFAMARRLHEHWTSRTDSLAPGDEYDLVDEFAEMLGIRGWFDWIPDVG